MNCKLIHIVILYYLKNWIKECMFLHSCTYCLPECQSFVPADPTVCHTKADSALKKINYEYNVECTNE